MTTPPSPGFRAGCQVLDLTERAGAFYARLLADLGAEIEPSAGDPGRRLGPFQDGALGGVTRDRWCAIAITEDHRSHRQVRENAEIGSWTLSAYPYSGTPAEIRHPGLLFGQDTGHVCRGVLGMPRGEIAALRAAGAFS